MRGALVRAAVAITAMVAFAFLLPLTAQVGRVTEQAATSRAREAIAAVAPVLAVTQDPAVIGEALRRHGSLTRTVGVWLPSGRQVGESSAPRSALDRARRGSASTVDLAGGRLLLQPVVLGSGDVAVIEAFVPDSELHAGLTRSRAQLVLLAVALVTGSAYVFDRMAARPVRSARVLARAARRIGNGDLDTRVPEGMAYELDEVGHAFNAMAERMNRMIELERELAADVTHRLRTPLTAVRLNAARLQDDPQAAPLVESIRALEHEVDLLIRRSLAGPDEDDGRGCDAEAVLLERLRFWAPLAEDQGRALAFSLRDRPTPVRVSAADLAAALDALLGNVFRHTPDGTACRVELAADEYQAEITVSDTGPGFAARPVQESARVEPGSTGRGLGIVRRTAIRAGGTVVVGGGQDGGRVVMALPLRLNGELARRSERPGRSRIGRRRLQVWLRLR